MSRRTFKSRLFATAAPLAGFAGAMLMSGAALAQTQPIPPEHYTLDPRGVDLVSGTFNHGTTEVVIGQPGAGGLAYGRTFANGGWRDNLIGGITIGEGELTVSVGPISEVFIADGPNWVSKYNNGSTYEAVGSEVIITDRAGNRAVFNVHFGSDPNDNQYGADGGLITSFATPAGEVTSYTYQTGIPCSLCTKIYRLSAVANNRGYMLKYGYASNTVSDPTWWRLTKVEGLNLAVDYCDPSANSCASLTRTWPSVTYGGFTTGGSPTTATDQSGRTTTYGYGTGGRITAIRSPGAASDDVAVTYDTLSPDLRVIGVTDASGAWTYGYSVSGATQITSAAGPLGQALTVLTDTATGRATSVTDGLSRTWAYQYDSDLRTTRVTQPEGDYASFTYDGRGNQTGTTWTSKGGALPVIAVATTYPSSCVSPVTHATCNRPISTTDARGAVTDYDWDETTGLLVSVTAPAPTTGADRPQTRYAYAAQTAQYKNSSGVIVPAPSAITLPVEVSTCATGTSCDGAANEVLTTVAYGSAGVANNLLPTSASQGSGTNPAMAVTAMTYTANGDVETVDGPLAGSGDVTRYRYDDARQVVGVVGPDPDGGGAGLNRAQRLTYNPRGQVTLAETGTTPGYTDPNWASFNPLVRSETVYDGYGRPSIARQQTGPGTTVGVQQISYDAAGRPDCTVVRMNPASFGSPPTSACTAATAGSDGPDRIAQTTYDAVGRPISTTSALGLPEAITQSVTYTANGQVASLIDGNGNVSIQEYDAFDRPTRLRYPNAGSSGTSTTDYEEVGDDAAGNVVSSRNRAGQITTIAYDALNRPTAIDAPTGTQDVSYAYDNLGRTLTSTGSGQTLTNAWDPLSRLTSETGPLGAMGYQYDAASRMTRITWPDAFYAQYDHDLYGAVTAIRENGAVSGAGVLAQYAHNDLGQPTGVTRGDGTATGYGYDAAGRMTGLSHDLAGSTNDVPFGYAWNPAGQIASRTVSNPAYVYAPTTGSTAYVNDGLNRVTSIDGTVVGYNWTQEITSALGNSYGYDAAGRLLSAAIGGGGDNFEYDPSGRLYSSYEGRFQYAGGQLTGEYDSVGALTARHVPGPRLDEPVASYSASSRTQQIADERGSVIGLADSGGAVSVNRYDEYGVPAAGSSGRFQYTGQARMAPGVYNYRARAYAPELGRFLQPDPIGYAAGANLYAYVGGDPVNLVDPRGSLACGYDLIGLFTDFVDPATGKVVDSKFNGTVLRPNGQYCGASGGGAFSVSFGAASGGSSSPPDRCSALATPYRRGGRAYTVDPRQMSARVLMKYGQHSLPNNPVSGRPQSYWASEILYGNVLSYTAYGILTHSTVRAGGVNVRLTFDVEQVVGYDYMSQSDTTFITVILGPAIPSQGGTPQRNVVSVYPGCPRA